MATRHNAALIKTGRVRVVRADAEKLPFEDGAFDKAMAVHVVYFWRSLSGPLAEIARILEPGGQLVLLFRARDDPRAASFPREVYQFPGVDEVTLAMERAGFMIDKVTPTAQPARPTPVVIRATRVGMAPVREVP